jgi:hypothetical protein
MISDYWINNRLKVYKKNNLVYVSTFKCAHTYYCKIVEHNNWEAIEFKNIDWLSDHVFGFIMDPVERYLKGLAEDIQTNDQMEHLEALTANHETDNFTVLTIHSAPISVRYRDYINDIDWIPLDISPNSEFFFKKLCSTHGIDIDIPPEMITWRHATSQEKKQRYLTIKNMFGNFNETFYRIFSTDIDFYHTVNTNFNSNGHSWDEISWLKNYSLSKNAEGIK